MFIHEVDDQPDAALKENAQPSASFRGIMTARIGPGQ
jgi:hypothetical protein